MSQIDADADEEDFGRRLVTAEAVDAWLSRLRPGPRPAAAGATDEPRPAADEAPGKAPAEARPRPAAAPRPARPPRATARPRRFADRRVPPASVAAALVLAGLVWASTGFYMVQPDQVGVVQRFGARVAVTGPGLNYHLPAPIETVRLPRVTAINQLDIARGAGTQMLTGDENIVEATAAVSWRVKDPAQYLFEVSDPEQTVQVAAESAVREVIALNPIQSALSDQREKIAEQAQKLLQGMLDFYEAGIAVTQVQLQSVDPPAAVIDAFNDVQRARADQQRARNEAEAYRNDILPRARGEADRIGQDAQAYAEQVTNQAKGEASRFLALDGSYREARDVTARRLYLDAMEEVLRASGKILVSPSDGAATPLVPTLPLGAAAPAAPPAPKAAP